MGMTVTLGYWKIRGLAANIRHQLAYSKVKDYKLNEYTQGEGPEFSRADWMDKKFTVGLDFPNLPYLIGGDIKLTETHAIHKYLAGKYSPELLPIDLKENAHVDMLSGVIKDFRMSITMMCYREASVSNEKQKQHLDKLSEILKFKGQQKFLFGDQVKWLDFEFFEVLLLLKMINYSIPSEANEYITSMKTLLGDDYCANSIDNGYTFNNKVALNNGKLS